MERLGPSSPSDEHGRQIAPHFSISAVASQAPLPGGHIHASFVVQCRDGRRYVLQRINRTVFPRPVDVTQNIARVTEHLHAKHRAAGDTDWRRRALTLVPARGGGHIVHDDAGEAWRAYEFVEQTIARHSVGSPAQAYAVARAFGEFQRLLADLPPPPLHETIPGFHDTPARIAALEDAVRRDQAGRVPESRREIDAVLARRSLGGALLALRGGGVPERIVHNDAKMSNVLFDAASGEPLCVIDLDIVMPGMSLFDFGDMVRSMSCAAAEDERDLSRVRADPLFVAALMAGYTAGAGGMLLRVEHEHMLTAGRVITLEQAARFLADHLNGDTYYRVDRSGQNLDRVRAQLSLLESLERLGP